VEVGDTTVVEDITLWGSLEGFLVLEDSFFESFNLLGEAVELHGRVGLAVGDSGEESVRDGAKEDRIDVGVGSKVDWVVLGDIAGGAGVAGRGIGRGAEDSAGETFDRLIEPPDDMRTGQGYGQDRCDRYMAHRSSSGGWDAVSV